MSATNDENTIRTVDLTPTPEGMRIIVHVLLEQMERSTHEIKEMREKIRQATSLIDYMMTEYYDDSTFTNAQNFLIIEALQAFNSHLEDEICTEEERIEHIKEGLSSS